MINKQSIPSLEELVLIGTLWANFERTFPVPLFCEKKFQKNKQEYLTTLYHGCYKSGIILQIGRIIWPLKISSEDFHNPFTHRMYLGGGDEVGCFFFEPLSFDDQKKLMAVWQEDYVQLPKEEHVSLKEIPKEYVGTGHDEQVIYAQPEILRTFYDKAMHQIASKIYPEEKKYADAIRTELGEKIDRYGPYIDKNQLVKFKCGAAIVSNLLRADEESVETIKGCFMLHLRSALYRDKKILDKFQKTKGINTLNDPLLQPITQTIFIPQITEFLSQYQRFFGNEQFNELLTRIQTGTKQIGWPINLT